MCCKDSQRMERRQNNVISRIFLSRRSFLPIILQVVNDSRSVANPEVNDSFDRHRDGVFRQDLEKVVAHTGKSTRNTLKHSTVTLTVRGNT